MHTLERHWKLTFNRYLLARIICYLIKKFGFHIMLYPDHFGHQAADVEYDLRTIKKKLIYLARTTPNKALRKIHERYATIIDVNLWIWQNLIEAEIAFKVLSQPLSRDLKCIYDSKEVWSSTPALEFTEEEIAHCKGVLAYLGLEEGKYVAFHARDSKYGSAHHPQVIKDRMSERVTGLEKMDETHPFQRHRNADFTNYLPAIQMLMQHGLKAVRLGSEVESTYKMPNLVDYAGQREAFANPELLDLYLMKHAKLYVGMATGISHLSCIFNTRAIAVNWFPHVPGSRPTANFIACRVKRIKYLEKIYDEFRSRHFFELCSWPQIYAVSSEIETLDSTPEDILNTLNWALEQDVAKAA